MTEEHRSDRIRRNSKIGRRYASTKRIVQNQLSGLTYNTTKKSALNRLGLRVSKTEWAEAMEFCKGMLNDLPDEVSGYAGALDAIFVILRRVRPEVVVETGVANGVSSLVFLEALRRNGKGELYSIDAPNLDPTAAIPAGKSTGWLVPIELRRNWHLIIGDSRAMLPKLMTQLGSIDVFHHDSLHTYANMEFEFSTAWTSLKPGGFLISDNTDLNSAFKVFVDSVKSKHVVLEDVGFCVKSADITGLVEER